MGALFLGPYLEKGHGQNPKEAAEYMQKAGQWKKNPTSALKSWKFMAVWRLSSGQLTAYCWKWWFIYSGCSSWMYPFKMVILCDFPVRYVNVYQRVCPLLDEPSWGFFVLWFFDRAYRVPFGFLTFLGPARRLSIIGSLAGYWHPTWPVDVEDQHRAVDCAIGCAIGTRIAY